MFPGSPPANKVKIQSLRMKDWLAGDITQHVIIADILSNALMPSTVLIF